MPPYRPPGYIARPGQEIVGLDFECAGSVLDGMCALPSGLGAILVCYRQPECQAVVVYPQGERPVSFLSWVPGDRLPAGWVREGAYIGMHASPLLTAQDCRRRGS